MNEIAKNLNTIFYAQFFYVLHRYINVLRYISI